MFLSIAWACTGSNSLYSNSDITQSDRPSQNDGSDESQDDSSGDGYAGEDADDDDDFGSEEGIPGDETEIPDGDEAVDPAPDAPSGEMAGALVADGDTEGTYGLILRSGYNYETPDTSGAHRDEPFQHITQSPDEQLGKYVFDFHIHIDNDDDRGLPNITDRQRNEIKTDGKSPASMVGQPGETMVFRWKFRLPEGMKTTTKFCHIHQIKGIDNKQGTADVGNPVITYTLRTQSNGKQQFQVIYVGPTAEKTGNIYLDKADLAGFLGQWVEVEERITFGEEGLYNLSIKRISDGRELVSVKDEKRNMWREGSTGLRPKWGIYRSFGEGGSLKPELRDEILKFADFSIEKLDL